MSSSVSTCPYIIVAVPRNPTWCDARTTSIQVSALIFSGLMRSRTRSDSTSAPPPGSVRWPASHSASKTSVYVFSATSAIPAISGGDQKCGVTCG